ncbi:hypothetical protein [Vreelandella aquamarina]|uniref:hypothetical protein n=1 Tax=Vreelandella aquamarina TaxID=77097 RepID=UPI00384BDB2C
MLTPLQYTSFQGAWINAISLHALMQHYGNDALELRLGSYLARLNARQVKLLSYAECEDGPSLLREIEALYAESKHYGCIGLAWFATQLFSVAEREAFSELIDLIAQMPPLIQRTRCAFKQQGAYGSQGTLCH